MQRKQRSMGTVISVSPFRCRVWDQHVRYEDQITERDCEAEIKSFEEVGQLVPALGRRLHNDVEHDIELIYGARRLFVARHINQPLMVEIRQLSDREALVAMDIENRQRKDISPYTLGLGYAQWLRAGYFSSQEDIARTLRVSASKISRLLKLASLPAVVVSAFGNTDEICERWGIELSDILANPLKRTAALQAARRLVASSTRPPPQDVYRELIASTVSRGRKVRMSGHDKVIKGQHGDALFRVKYQRSSIALILPLDKISGECLSQIEQAVASILDTEADEQSGTILLSRDSILHGASL